MDNLNNRKIRNLSRINYSISFRDRDWKSLFSMKVTPVYFEKFKNVITIKVLHQFKTKKVRGEYSRWVSPNIDVMASMIDLLKMETSDIENIYSVSKGSASFVGLLRALNVLKVLSPDVYNAVILLSKYFSYEVDESKMCLPVALVSPVKPDGAVIDAVKKAFGVNGNSPDIFSLNIYSTIKTFEDAGILKHFAFFSERVLDDKEMIQKFVDEIEEKGMIKNTYFTEEDEKGIEYSDEILDIDGDSVVEDELAVDSVIDEDINEIVSVMDNEDFEFDIEIESTENTDKDVATITDKDVDNKDTKKSEKEESNTLDEDLDARDLL